MIEEELRYLVTTGFADDPGGYYAALGRSTTTAPTGSETHLRQGCTVVVLAVVTRSSSAPSCMSMTGSPLYPTAVVPGVTSVSAATAAVATGLCRHEDTLTILPGTCRCPNSHDGWPTPMPPSS